MTNVWRMTPEGPIPDPGGSPRGISDECRYDLEGFTLPSAVLTDEGDQQYPLDYVAGGLVLLGVEHASHMVLDRDTLLALVAFLDKGQKMETKTVEEQRRARGLRNDDPFDPDLDW